jgi:nucleotide-binding universal stress UspA family protein
MIGRILVATDFSDASEAALALAEEMGRRFGAELALFHAQQVPSYLFPDGIVPVPSSVLADLQASVVAELERLAARARAHGVRAEVRHSIGGAADEICRAAAEWPADLIVVGTHGRSGLRHVLLGSVADKVMRKAPCPVVTVHPPKADEAHPT